MKLTFSLSASRAAKKSLGSLAPLRTLLKLAASAVAAREFSMLPQVTVGVVLLSDDELLEINRSSLGHDWLTDIITFEIERTADALETEIYISTDRSKENAKRYRVAMQEELEHLVIHGMLHLAGMRDKTTSEMNQMRKRERWYLAKLHSGNSTTGKERPNALKSHALPAKQA